jgi:hypothetical protein
VDDRIILLDPLVAAAPDYMAIPDKDAPDGDAALAQALFCLDYRRLQETIHFVSY